MPKTKYTLTIVVDNGDTFEGTLDDWQDCFFYFPLEFTIGECLDQVLDFCRCEGWNVRIEYKKA